MHDKILYDYAMSFVGLPYIWGGDDPIYGFDCSGLVIELMQSCGLFPHGQDTTAQGLFDYFEHGKATYASGASFGSLIFYGKSVTKISHVGFALDQYRVLEAGGGGSSTHDQDAAAMRNAYIRIRPIDHRKDRQAILKPFYRVMGHI